MTHDSFSDTSISYWKGRKRIQGIDLVFRHYLLELVRHVGDEQARALSYHAGTSVAKEAPLIGIEKIGEIEKAAQQFLAARDWGWLRLEEREDSVDFVHGCSPSRAWFGDGCLTWAPSFFEGLFAEWVRQLGASEMLELRQIQSPEGEDDISRFRLMHESQFT